MDVGLKKVRRLPFLQCNFKLERSKTPEPTPLQNYIGNLTQSKLTMKKIGSEYIQNKQSYTRSDKHAMLLTQSISTVFVHFSFIFIHK